MNTLSRYYWNNEYSDLDWSGMKWSFIVGWNLCLLYIYSSLVSTSDPKGLCTLFDCNVLQFQWVKILMGLVLIVSSILYVREQWMLMTTISLTIISLVVFSAGESNGIAARCEILTAVLIAQVAAYTKYMFTKDAKSLSQDRIRYSIQIIVALYMLAVLSKIRASDFDWIYSNDPLAINAKVAILRFKADFGIEGLEIYANFMYKLFSNNPNFVASFLVISLIVEGLIFIALFGKRWAISYGVLLIIFHSTIFLTMFVFVPPFLLCVFVYLLNGPFLVTHALKRLFNN